MSFSSQWNQTLTERQRVLLHTQPLLLMRYHWLRSDDVGQLYDPLFLCMKLFDFVIDQCGFGNDVVRDTVVHELTPLLRSVDEANQVEPDETRYQRVVDRILANLLNDSKRGESFSIDYTDFDGDGRSSRKTFSFKLLKEVHGYSGSIALELSPEAINLFLNALNLDIESEQIATDAVIQYQLERGKFTEARSSAETARARSIQYEQNVQRIIEQVKRDIRQVNWRDEVHATLVAANEHIDFRLRIERNIVRSASRDLDALAEDDENRRALAEVVRLIDDCSSRHMRLSKRLMTARGEFIDQQSRQCFVDGGFMEQIDLRDEVLQPILNLSSGDVLGLADRVGHALLGPRTPTLLSLTELIAWQLQPKREFTVGETSYEEIEWVDTDAEMSRLDEEVLGNCHKVFDELAESTRLSELLERLESDGIPLAIQDAVTLQILERFDAEDEQCAAQIGVELVDRGGLDVQRCAGDDLLVVRLD